MQDQHELTMAEAVDVMEDVARFMNACARWRHQDHVFFAGPDRGIDHAKELASCALARPAPPASSSRSPWIQQRTLPPFLHAFRSPV